MNTLSKFVGGIVVVLLVIVAVLLSQNSPNVTDTGEENDPVVFTDVPEVEEDADESLDESKVATDLGQTYASEAFNLQFRYPDGWILDEDTAINVYPENTLPSNYFTIEKLFTEFSPYEDLQAFVHETDSTLADFTLDEVSVYTRTGATEASGTLVYYMFEHNGTAYQLYMFEDHLGLPEVQAMIASLELL